MSIGKCNVVVNKSKKNTIAYETVYRWIFEVTAEVVSLGVGWATPEASISSATHFTIVLKVHAAFVH